MGDEEELSVEYLDISIIKISNNHGGNTFCKDNDFFTFSFFYPNKRAFYAIKRSADNSDRCAFLQVDFVRCKINEFLIECVARCYELLHLIFRDSDGDSSFTCRACMILQVLYTRLQGLNTLTCSVNKYQILYCRYQLLCFLSIAHFSNFVTHGHETFHIVLFKKSLCLQFPAKRSTHSKPEHVCTSIVRQVSYICH